MNIDKRATKVLVDSLVNGHIELDGDPDDALAQLVDDTDAWLGEHARHPLVVEMFGRFLEQHPAVAETYATDGVLEEKLAAWAEAIRRFATPVAHRNAALEQQILDNLDDDSARLVYGDWLQQQGDPLGELVVRQSSNNARVAKRLLTEHGTFFFGPAEEYVKLFKVEYRLGFIRSITLTRERKLELEWPVVASWLLERPIARFVEQVQIGPIASAVQNVEAGVWNALLAHERPALRALGIATKVTRYGEAIDLALVAHAPRLRELRIEGMRVQPGAFAHPSLERLELLLESAPPELAAALVASSLPALRELAITTRFETVPHVWPRDAPALRVLRLALGGTPAVVETLLRDPALPRLAVLELAFVDNAAARVLLANAHRFAHLDKLVLARHAVHAGVARDLKRAIPGIDVRDATEG